MFRVRVGTYVSWEPEKWWNYGIADERDFNGDGVPDYSWYGGDDTGFEMYLFLSRDGRFERVNILKTVATAWQQRHRKSPPDFGIQAVSTALTRPLLLSKIALRTSSLRFGA